MTRTPVAAPPIPIRYACAGCGHEVPADAGVPLQCPDRVPDDDVDHLMTRVPDTGRLSFPVGAEANPFVRYRGLFHAYHRARAHGWSDGRYVALVNRLDGAVAAVDGTGFRATPFARQDALSDRLGFTRDGGIFVKDETGNVAGSHKARHLMGTLIELEVAEAIDGAPVGRPRLAIASCGNAALAAAVVARAAGRDLDVFIPTDADPAVVARLRDLDAHVVVCQRAAGIQGDPTVSRLREAVANGAIAFTCQGNENGLAIEGGLTLGYELATDIVGRGMLLDRLFVQVGGGALASSCIQGLAEARGLGAPVGQPAVHPVQAAAVAPLARAYERLAHRLDREGATADDLAWAAQHRSAFMWPWEGPTHSVASGIVDDETYDWLAVVRGTLSSGGWPVTVDEPTLLEANDLARTSTGIDVDVTGSAGLAGLVELHRHGRVDPADSVAVIFSGVRRPSLPEPSPSMPYVGEPR